MHVRGCFNPNKSLYQQICSRTRPRQRLSGAVRKFAFAGQDLAQMISPEADPDNPLSFSKADTPRVAT
jgi:hypothetical protein